MDLSLTLSIVLDLSGSFSDCVSSVKKERERGKRKERKRVGEKQGRGETGTS